MTRSNKTQLCDACEPPDSSDVVADTYVTLSTITVGGSLSVSLLVLMSGYSTSACAPRMWLAALAACRNCVTVVSLVLHTYKLAFYSLNNTYTAYRPSVTLATSFIICRIARCRLARNWNILFMLLLQISQLTSALAQTCLKFMLYILLLLSINVLYCNFVIHFLVL